MREQRSSQSARMQKIEGTCNWFVRCKQHKMIAGQMVSQAFDLNRNESKRDASLCRIKTC